MSEPVARGYSGFGYFNPGLVAPPTPPPPKSMPDPDRAVSAQVQKENPDG